MRANAQLLAGTATALSQLGNEFVSSEFARDQLERGRQLYGSSLSEFVEGFYERCYKSLSADDRTKIQAALASQGVDLDSMLKAIAAYDAALRAGNIDPAALRAAADKILELCKIFGDSSKFKVPDSQLALPLVAAAGLASFVGAELLSLVYGYGVTLRCPSSEALDLGLRLRGVQSLMLNSLEELQAKRANNAKRLAEIAKLQGQIDAMTSRKAELQRKINALNEEKDRADQARKDAIEQEIGQLNQTISQIESRLPSTTQRLEQMRGEQVLLAAEIGNLQARVEAEQAALREQSSKLRRPQKGEKFKMWSSALAEAAADIEKSGCRDEIKTELRDALLQLDAGLDKLFAQAANAIGSGVPPSGDIGPALKLGWEFARAAANIQESVRVLFNRTGAGAAALADIGQRLKTVVGLMSGYIGNNALVLGSLTQTKPA
jgi:hypothetical protein